MSAEGRTAEQIIRAVIKPSLPDTSEITAGEVVTALTRDGYLITRSGPLMTREGPDTECSFCGKVARNVRVVTGPGVNICADCIDLCQAALSDPAPAPAPAEDEPPIYCNGCHRCHGKPRSYSCSGMDCFCSAH